MPLGAIVDVEVRPARRRGPLFLVAVLCVPLLLSLLTAGTAALSPKMPGVPALAGTVPHGLPAHVLLGLANWPQDVGWMASSGAHWDARYAYLAGGVNTGHGWATWNRPAGAF